MSNEETKDVDLNNDGDTANQNDSKDSSADGADNKQFESPEAKKARLDRQQEQLKRKHPELYEVETKKTESKSSDLDYGQKAFLIANGIKGSEETQLVQEIMKSTGKSLDDVLESKYFQAELKEMREIKKTEDALPTGSNRSGQSASNTVEYWIAKGELPPASERELRTKVVNARIKASQDTNVFTSNPVVR